MLSGYKPHPTTPTSWPDHFKFPSYGPVCLTAFGIVSCCQNCYVCMGKWSVDNERERGLRDKEFHW